jgi:hypothetical protein
MHIFNEGIVVMSSGGKGGGTTSQVEIPKWVEKPATRNLQRAEQIQQMDYMPYYGADVAALTPMQQQSMQNTVGAAQAFGMAPQDMDAMAGMPVAREYADGTVGYTAGGLYDQAVAEVNRRRPVLASQRADLFSDYSSEWE